MNQISKLYAKMISLKQLGSKVVSSEYVLQMLESAFATNDHKQFELPDEVFTVPEIVLVGYGRTQLFQIRCLKCRTLFFPAKNKTEVFCEKCDMLSDDVKESYLTDEHLSLVPCIGIIVGWESKSSSTTERSRYNYAKVYKRDGYECRYCGYNPRTHEEFIPLWIDHVTPHAYGGGHAMDNLVVACQTCNQIASSKVFRNLYEKKKYILQTRINRNLKVDKSLVKAFELKVEHDQGA